MDVPTSSSDCLFCSQLYHAYSCKRCTFFLLIFLLFLVIIVGLAALSVIFIIKPQKPIFSLESFRVVSYDLNTDSNSTLFLPSLVSTILEAKNPNKVLGIKYSPSRLHLYLGGLAVGVIRVPAFNQPPHSGDFKVALDYSIDFDYKELRLVYAASHIIKVDENYNETFPVGSNSLFNKCDLAIYI